MLIRDARKIRNWSQGKMAQELGIPKRTIEDWETEKREAPAYVRTLVVEAMFRQIRDEAEAETGKVHLWTAMDCPPNGQDGDSYPTICGDFEAAFNAAVNAKEDDEDRVVFIAISPCIHDGEMFLDPEGEDYWQFTVIPRYSVIETERNREVYHSFTEYEAKFELEDLIKEEFESNDDLSLEEATSLFKMVDNWSGIDRRYVIRDSEAGNEIDDFSNLKAAKKALASYIKEDMSEEEPELGREPEEFYEIYDRKTGEIL